MNLKGVKDLIALLSHYEDDLYMVEEVLEYLLTIAAATSLDQVVDGTPISGWIEDLPDELDGLLEDLEQGTDYPDDWTPLHDEDQDLGVLRRLVREFKEEAGY